MKLILRREEKVPNVKKLRAETLIHFLKPYKLDLNEYNPILNIS